MKKVIFLSIIIVLTIFLGGCGKKQNSALENTNQALNQNINQTSTEGRVYITLKNFTFIPATITIKDGTIITWKNEDNASHQIVADETPAENRLPSLESYIMAPNQEWSYTFDGRGFFGQKWDDVFLGKGTFNYHRQLHPEMKGTIVVE